MLARRGHGTVLHLSVSNGGEAGMTAHAWLTLGGASVIGGPADQVEVAQLSLDAGAVRRLPWCWTAISDQLF